MTRLFEAKPFVVAEIGSNWSSFEQCVESIGKAKAAGADAVKFQAFNAQALYGIVPLYGDEGRKYGAQVARVADSSLLLDWLPKLKEKAKACGIEFMCTAFSPELVEAVDPFVSVHKVASSDNTTPQMLKAVQKTGKPVLLSCGAASKGDVAQAVGLFPRDYPLVLLYCASAYPSRRHNLFLIDELREETGRMVGLSDHSQDVIYAPLAAVRTHGAVVIEKHVTAFPDMQSPDRPHSLTMDEFKIMVDYLRGKRDGGGFNPTSEERDMFLRSNRRLVAIRDIKPGDVLRYGENFGAYRSLEDDAEGYSPMLWEKAEGRQALAALQRGKGLGPKTVNLA